MIVRSAGITVPGKVRASNQDNFFINGTFKQDPGQGTYAVEDDRDPEKNLFAVCDGMGGYEHGEQASFKALQVLKDYSIDHIFKDPGDYVAKANRAICEEIIGDSGESVGTTLAIMGTHNGKAFFCNVGDSRIYLVRKGMLEQISVDHTRAQSMVNAGIIDEDEAKNIKEAHILSQHLGIAEDEFLISPKIRKDFNMKAGDIFIICSDGLTTMVDDQDIEKIVKKNRRAEAKKIVVALLERALKRGGTDNISIIIVKVDQS